MLTTDNAVSLAILMFAVVGCGVFICHELRVSRQARHDRALRDAEEARKQEARAQELENRRRTFALETARVMAGSMSHWVSHTVHLVLERTGATDPDCHRCKEITAALIGSIRGNRPSDAPFTPEENHRLVDAVANWSHEQLEAHHDNAAVPPSKRREA